MLLMVAFSECLRVMHYVFARLGIRNEPNNRFGADQFISHFNSSRQRLNLHCLPHFRLGRLLSFLHLSSYPFL
ncbi:hypothetical protein DI53_3304 [Sphingobacterium deserti]|uniref:Uncharacterized protein n=1 Tax=Sphingobacterium deserti TaxID=1229276 RepID=A0A0B8SZ42_9SPHI|nr:hypothetical protein DI53_3304 [Sphingobacterium deserti]